MGLRSALSGRRGRLAAVLLLATAAVSLLAIRAAGESLAYYTTPEEFAQQLDASGKRWRVGGRVVEGTIVEENSRPSRFEIVGEHGERMTISYPDGPVPSLFGPTAFVVVEGESDASGTLLASSLIIKHEDEFLTEDELRDRSGLPGRR